MKLILSDSKTGKAYNKKTEEPVFLNKKVGDEVDLGTVGLPGFKAVIRGGSDKQGFPMKPSLEGTGRKKILARKGIGVKSKGKGVILRKSMRANGIGPDIVQLNLLITAQGEKLISDFIKPSEGKKEEAKESSKERMVKESLENVGNVDMAEEAKKIKGKVRG